MAIERVGTSDGMNYTLIPQKMGVEMCCLEAVGNESNDKLHGFMMPDSSFKNCRALYYKVIKIGDDVTSINGIKEGDYVFVDALARFADTHPISFINCRNIIAKTDETASTVIALRGQIITKIHEFLKKTNEYGFIETQNLDPFGEVVSIGEGCEDRGFGIGDIISTTSNAIMFMFRGDKYFIYENTEPVFKWNETAFEESK